MLKLLLPLLLLVSVGDKTYDPVVKIDSLVIAKNVLACVAYTGWWEVEEVGVERGKTYAAGSSMTDEIIHSIFFLYSFNSEAYYAGLIGSPPEAKFCNQLDLHVKDLNICLDYRQPPTLVCK